MSAPAPAPGSESLLPAVAVITWTEDDKACSARWRSERGAQPPKRVVLADDTLAADAAYRLACEGTALLWRGDFQNARQLLQALARRVDKPAKPARRKTVQTPDSDDAGASAAAPADAFHRHRQAQAQRARVLGMVLVQLDAGYGIALRRAPDVRQACTEAWGAPEPDAGDAVVSLREVLGLIGAHEWRKKGVEVAALGEPPGNRIHPHYGVFSPVRGEYVSLVAQMPLPPTGESPFTAFDIGTGTGVLAAVLTRRGIHRVVATDQDPRALACAKDNLARLKLQATVELLQTDLFPEGRASLVVCNPPWLPARPGSPIEGAIYDEGSQMLLGFLKGLAPHLLPGGEGWLILSDLAEHLGLRTRAWLLAAIDETGLKVLGRADTKPNHPKVLDETDPLHRARAAEITSLWRLAPAP
ncbi:class I SAM-dependent methyltransferase [Polaromonas sp.]|jgi:SAM-dependent methyltransferase|uniref:class I SAM-dependent methyltransferase n=1 Tax=Polaromonas sp. TaxID=1869339 RepID=UPI002BC42A3B|nr:class I SAM-dependent methyltransferase [Polaromonas sp.]HQS30968.1 class I SAM-dependent methyltransferase [Polaromonas sp.]HQS90153.1 class I SAM-dependent methyltransferase [Polaromonas sp.]